MRRLGTSVLTLLAVVAAIGPGRAEAVVSPAYEGMSMTGGPHVVTVPAPGGLAVNTWNGSVFLPRQILPLTGGRGLPIDLSLSYNSIRQNWPVGQYGVGWNLSYHVWICLEANGNVVVNWGDGREDRWHPTANGLQPFNKSVFTELLEPEPGTWVLRTPKGIEYEFKKPAVNERSPMRRLRDPNGNELSIESDGQRPLAINDASGRRIALTYDNRRRLTTVTDNATSPARTVRFTYNTAGEESSMTDALGNVTTYEYDSGHRMTRVRDPAGITNITYGGPKMTVERITRTTLGGVVLADRSFAFDNKVTRVTDVIGGATTATTTYAYQSNASVIITDPLGGKSTVAYDGNRNPASLVDANGKRWTWTHDARGNVLSRRDPLGRVTSATYDPTFNVPLTQTDGAGKVTHFGYDGRGNLTSAKDPLGHVTSFVYDSVGQVTERHDPRGKVTRYDYDTDGNLIKVTDPLGRERAFTYDGASRMVGAGAVTYGYNALNQLTAVGDGAFTYDALGNLSGATGPNTDLAFNWDPAGRLVAVTDGQLGKTVAYTYDGLSRQTSMKANGRVTAYEHDLAGRLVRMTDGAAVHRFDYDSGGRLIGRTEPNGRQSTYGYDDADQLTEITRRNAGGSLLTSVVYGYDGAGRRDSDTRSNGVAIDYDWDDAGRLVGEKRTGSGAYARQLAYDEAGNRTQLDAGGVTTTYDYDDANELVAEHTGAKTTTYDYDGAGNLARRGDTTYGYDTLGRLTDVTTPSGSVSYANDVFGLRSGKLRDYTTPVPERVSALGLSALPGVTPLEAHPDDPATGLHDFDGRAYDPATGRFLQPSAMGDYALMPDAAVRRAGVLKAGAVGAAGTATVEKLGTGLRPANLVPGGSDKAPAGWGGASWFARWWASDPNLALTGTPMLSPIQAVFYNGAMANSCGTFPSYAVGNVP